MKSFSFFIISLFCLSLTCVRAEHDSLANSIYYNFTDQQGKQARLNLSSYTNQNNEMELRIEATGIPRFAEKINPLIGFGRDLNHNGKIDSWFILSKNGIELVQKEGVNSFGTDVLNDILKDKYKTTFKMYASSAALSILSYLSITANAGINIQEEFYQDWMDLEQLRIQSDQDLDKLTTSQTRTQALFYSEMISLGYKDLALKMEQFSKKSFWGYAFADIGLWISGAIVIKWVAKIFVHIGVIATENAFINSIKEVFVSFFEKQKNLIESRLQSMKNRSGPTLAKKEVVFALTMATYKQALKNTLRAQNAKFRIREKLISGLNFSKSTFENAKADWKYLMINSSIQLGSETYARYDQIYDPDKMTMAKNLLTNPEVIQNVSYMAAETIMMTGVTKNFKTIKGKLLAGGVVALTNSAIMNFLIKDDVNYKRVAFDTAWESTIGSAQVQLDLAALRFFEKISNNLKSPSVKLVGYIVAGLDMTVGYYYYSKASSALNKNEVDVKQMTVNPVLIPIFVEQ